MEKNLFCSKILSWSCSLMVGFFMFVHKASAQTVGSSTTSLPNPLNTTDVRVVIGNVINATLGIVGAVALLMFVIGGYYWLVSGGSSQQIEKGKKTLVWASLGLIVVFASYLIVGFLIQAFTQSSGS